MTKLRFCEPIYRRKIDKHSIDRRRVGPQFFSIQPANNDNIYFSFHGSLSQSRCIFNPHVAMLPDLSLCIFKRKIIYLLINNPKTSLSLAPKNPLLEQSFGKIDLCNTPCYISFSHKKRQTLI